MNFFFLYITLLASLLNVDAASHKFYVSKTEMEINTRSGMFEVSMKFFTDDLERALHMSGSGPLRLGEPEQHPEAPAKVENYIRSKWHINMNGNQVYPAFVGMETEMDMMVVYFEFVPAPVIHQLTVTNQALMEVFNEQKNVVDITMFGSTQTLVLTTERSTETIYR